jgi:hypothetical protein
MKSCVCGVVALALIAGAGLASAQVVSVDARSNIFGYGVGTPAPAGGGGGVVAPQVALPAGTGRTMQMLATGSAGWAGSLVNGPDGGTFSLNTNIPSVGPISGFSAPLSGQLVGVFIEAGDISGLSAPGALSYPDAASLTLASYSPGLRQVFFIGDGRTGTGSGPAQTFNIPDGAGFLVLGIADAFGFNGQAGAYDDNVGSYTVSLQIVPTPGAAALLGAGALMAGRRRR